jgi:D-aminoacyl-tRNA deacylase
MKVETAIICSKSDPASLNIFERLLELEAWQDRDGYKSSGNWRLLLREDKLTAMCGVDSLLGKLGLHPEMIVFACRHVSKSGLPWLGGHFTGIYENGRRELSVAAPSGLCSFLHNITRIAPQGFQISAEATHHGPADIKTPSFFAEIGSSEDQWRDVKAGDAIARAILAMGAREFPVFLGFGGGHYVQRQTELMFEAGIAFGHLFSSYKADLVDVDLVEDARRKSNATYAYIDRKSFRSIELKKIEGILEKLDLPLLKGKEIRAKFPLASDG